MALLAAYENNLIGPYGNRDNALEDSTTMASPAGVITPLYPITKVSGTNAITGITVPYPSFCGTIWFVPTGNFTWTTATNIGLAGTAVTGRLLGFTYLPQTAKWYPSYV